MVYATFSRQQRIDRVSGGGRGAKEGGHCTLEAGTDINTTVTHTSNLFHDQYPVWLAPCRCPIPRQGLPLPSLQQSNRSAEAQARHSLHC